MPRPRPRPPCPACGADDALALRRVQRHDPPLPLRWLAPLFPVHLTLTYACAACQRLVSLPTTRPRSLARVRAPGRRGAAAGGDRRGHRAVSPGRASPAR